MKNNVSKDQIALLKKSIEDDGIEKVVVGAVIRKDQKALLLRRCSSDFMGGLVELPSGGVDLNEEILEALPREIQEETGLTITTVIQYLGHFDYPSGSGEKTRQLNFLVSATGEVQLNPEEHDKSFLLELGAPEFESLTISKETKDIINRSFTF